MTANKIFTIVFFLFLSSLFSIFVSSISLEDCDGCIVGDKCLSLEARRAGLFCDLDGSVEQQKLEGDVCSFDYQCLSHSCSQGVCEKISFLATIKEGFSDIYTTLFNTDNAVTIISYEDETLELPANFSLRGCSGCFDDDGNCVGKTYRNAGKFCDSDHIFKKQKKGGEFCLADFQCKSNDCMRENKCRSTGFFRSIFLWIDGNN